MLDEMSEQIPCGVMNIMNMYSSFTEEAGESPIQQVLITSQSSHAWVNTAGWAE